ncbi:NfeD family protein [Pelagicoccus sp. SDUM812003]|uniref:NfeD family protein n=1 Tax=Pelagicoccus sp. SDUM812003 TaxID=3041267 RepID=UPI0028106BF3|nr:NfeD family protein [Pelagicoccus sp. SDUM812003]MDQ8204811.1 NfeD family protein [Pelagicoccus sp. SDUM812003]
MTNRCLTLLSAFLVAWSSPLFIRAQEVEQTPAESAAEPVQAESVEAPRAAAQSRFYVIPVQGPIGQPTLFAIRGGVKTAIEEEYDYVVLDMDTPGGRLDSTLEIMEVLDRFPGKTLTYVNDEATSAGAIIASVTQQIYFAPKATMGSAEPVTGQGEDINDSMKRKLMSYLNAKMEAYTGEYPYRSEVIRAMMDPDFELKIGDEVICPEGELLNLNAKRAHMEYGDPPSPLLGSGIVDELDPLLRSLAGGKEPQITRFQATWSLNLAEFIVSLAPFLLAVAFITVYIEFQSPGFGVFGITGVICFLVAIFGHNVAGLSGHEPMLLFLLGILLLSLEVFVAPGTLFFAIPGFVIMIASLIWAMADIWPANTPDYQWEWAMFEEPIRNLLGGSLLGIVMILILARFLPKTFIWDRLVLKEAVVGDARVPESPDLGTSPSPLNGSLARAVSDLHPSGEIEFEGRRFDARCETGSIRRGARVKVLRREDFAYVVEEARS